MTVGVFFGRYDEEVPKMSFSPILSIFRKNVTISRVSVPKMDTKSDLYPPTSHMHVHLEPDERCDGPCVVIMKFGSITRFSPFYLKTLPGNVKHVKRKSLKTREMLKVASPFCLTWPKTWEMLNMLNMLNVFGQ